MQNKKGGIKGALFSGLYGYILSFIRTTHTQSFSHTKQQNVTSNLVINFSEVFCYRVFLLLNRVFLLLKQMSHCNSLFQFKESGLKRTLCIQMINPYPTFTCTWHIDAGLIIHLTLWSQLQMKDKCFSKSRLCFLNQHSISNLGTFWHKTWIWHSSMIKNSLHHL